MASTCLRRFTFPAAAVLSQFTLLCLGLIWFLPARPRFSQYLRIYCSVRVAILRTYAVVYSVYAPQFSDRSVEPLRRNCSLSVPAHLQFEVTPAVFRCFRTPCHFARALLWLSSALHIRLLLYRVSARSAHAFTRNLAFFVTKSHSSV